MRICIAQAHARASYALRRTAAAGDRDRDHDIMMHMINIDHDMYYSRIRDRMNIRIMVRIAVDRWTSTINRQKRTKLKYHTCGK